MAAVEDTVPHEPAARTRRPRAARAIVVAVALALGLAASLAVSLRTAQRNAGADAAVAAVSRNAQGAIRLSPESVSPTPESTRALLQTQREPGAPLVDVARLKLDDTIRLPAGGLSAARVEAHVREE
jgi:hypothetical protein